MHDRRVDDEVLTFGNQGALYKRAMTWWDHGTRSLWSQPWGTALAGELEGTSLTLIPASIVPWSTWLADHPDTTVVSNDLDINDGGHRPAGYYPPERPRDNFVIGVALEGSATAYHYRLASERRVINDRIGPHPVAVFVDPDTRDIAVYLRKIGGSPDGTSASEAVFEVNRDGAVIDLETGSVWDVGRGIATEGALKGAVLQQIPYVTSFDWVIGRGWISSHTPPCTIARTRSPATSPFVATLAYCPRNVFRAECN